MLDVPVESTYVWIGLTIVGIALMGMALRVPTAPPPDATAVARTVDSVASSPYEASGRHPLDADAVRVGSERVGLRNDAGTAHAAFAYDTVVPVLGNDSLASVLRGRPPAAVFEDEAALAAALADAQTHEPRWQPAPERLLVRRAVWGDINATLVGA
ncbi:hypothetical protein BRC64_10625 [Halobacteriales archaeon QH_10_67_22]|nr:MAG: hypothetical protein BRC64_10625 [Halobacteriales archaeon QH_10_67_22]